MAPLKRRNYESSGPLGDVLGGNGRRAPGRDATIARGSSPYTAFGEREGRREHGRVGDLEEEGSFSSSVGGSAGSTNTGGGYSDAPIRAYSAAQLAQLTQALTAQPGAEMITDSLHALIAPLATSQTAAEGEGEWPGDA